VEDRCRTTESQPPLPVHLKIIVSLLLSIFVAVTVGFALRSALRVDTAIDKRIDTKLRDPKVYGQRATMPAESGPPITKVDRFTVWVIVPVIAMMVVYFWLALGWIKPSPPHVDASATVVRSARHAQ